MSLLDTAQHRPWYGLDDSQFVKGVEGIFVSTRRQRLVTKTWLPPKPGVALQSLPQPAAVPSFAPALEPTSPFPGAVLLFVHGYVRTC
jgi:hypothetical protein